MKTGQIRQGDVLLVPVDTRPPKHAKSAKEVVMAVGETTGHSHRLVADEILVWNDMIWVVGPEPGAIVHEDHDVTPAAVVVPEQTYRIVNQQERALTGEWKRVVD